MPAPPTPTPAAPPPAGGNSSSNSSIPNDSLPPEGVSPFVAGAPWVLDPRWDRVETLAGVLGQPGFADGVGDEAQFKNTRGLDVAPDCLRVFIADEKNHKIRVYDTLTAQVTTIAGGEKGAADGCGEAAQFLSPHQLAYAPGEILYVTDAKNNCVRQVDIATGCVTTIGGVCNGDDSTAGMMEGVGAAAQFDTPRSITVNSAGTKVYLGDNNNNRIRQYDVATKTWSTLTDGFGVKIGKPTGLKVSPDGTWLLLCDESSNSVQRVDTATGQLTFMAGAKVDFMTEETHNDGPAETATFWTPRGCTTDGKTVWIPDMRNNALRSLDLGTNMVSTVYGVGRDDPSTGYTPGLPYGRAILDGPVDIARADNPIAVAVCTEEIHGVPTELLFVGDDFTGTLRVVYPKIDAAIYKSNSLP